MHIIQIVPRLPPAIDGVGDYAYCLARQMRQDSGIQTHFIVGDPSWSGESELDGFPISPIDGQSAHKLYILLAEQHSANILLHYVGYGYAKRGCPFWLVKGLEKWKYNNQQARILTMFHEIAASGPIWTSAFWLSIWQRFLAEKLVGISDSLFTSQQLYAKILRQLSREKHREFPALPVFSSVGEPHITLPLTHRNNYLVVFGGKAKRLRVYQQSLEALRYTCEQLGIEKIIDIGPPIDLDLVALTRFPVQQMGLQHADAVSKVLLNSKVGFLNYNPNLLAKSTIFASYCSHKLIPVNALSVEQPIDSIVPGKQYWVPNLVHPEIKNESNLQAIADKAHAWYQDHSLERQAQIFSLRFQ